MGWLIGLLAVGVVIGAVVVVVAVIGGRKAVDTVSRNYARNNQVVPGIASPAPTSWLGSHDPEAKLHRRLIEAIKALHATQDMDTLGAYLDLRVEIEQKAVAIDNELVATAALPQNLRQDPLERLSAGVAAIEEIVAEINRAGAAGATAGLEEIQEMVRDRTSTLGRAREALEELEREQPLAAPPAQDADADAGEQGGSAGQPG